MIAFRDHTFVLYLIGCLVMAYTGSILLWWWARYRKGSPVFIYVVILIWGMCLNWGMLAISRYYSMVDIFIRDTFISSCWWPARLYVALIGIISIAVHMTYRIITSKEGEYPFGIKPFNIIDILKKVIK